VCFPIIIFISGQAFLSALFIALSSSVAACSRFLLPRLQGCVIVVLKDCMIVALQGCVNVVLQGCVIVVLRARLRARLRDCYKVS
jgi:hypothetical protein